MFIRIYRIHSFVSWDKNYIRINFARGLWTIDNIHMNNCKDLNPLAILSFPKTFVHKLRSVCIVTAHRELFLAIVGKNDGINPRRCRDSAGSKYFDETYRFYASRVESDVNCHTILNSITTDCMWIMFEVTVTQIVFTPVRTIQRIIFRGKTVPQHKQLFTCNLVFGICQTLEKKKTVPTFASRNTHVFSDMGTQ